MHTTPFETAARPHHDFNLQPGQHVLFVHAHPDDESMATAEALRVVCATQAVAHALTATDGEGTTLNYTGANDIGAARRQEAMAAWQHYGIPAERQNYLGMPDGGLATPWNRLRLAWRIGRIIATHDITAVFSPGPDGFDGHPDHITIDRSAILAVSTLRLLGKKVALWRLNKQGEGQVLLPVNGAQKIGGLRWHPSQFYGIRPAAQTQEAAPAGHSTLHGHYVPHQTLEYINHYLPLLTHETYDRFSLRAHVSALALSWFRKPVTTAQQ